MEEALIKRVLPHSLEAEQSVIGSMLMDREAVIAASEIVTGSDFYQQQYGIMFDAMVELFNEGKPVDLVTLQDRLKEKDVPPEVSSLDFVRDIVTMVPTSANVRSYATIVGEKAVLRRLIKTTEEIANTCYAGKEPLENILADTEKSVLTCCKTAGDRILCPSSRWPSTCWRRLRMPIRTREQSRVYHPALLTWIISFPVSSLRISF